MIDGNILPLWLTVLAWISIAASIASAIFIAAQIAAGQRLKMAVMNIVWPVTALYFGPAAIWCYRHLAKRAGGKGEKHDPQNHRPGWMAAFVGDTHCGAGCTVGDLAGEWTVFLTGFTIAGSVIWASFAIDFLIAYTVGIAFQYFAIAPMRHLSGWAGIAAAIKADTVSLIAFETGMFAWMAFSDKVLFHPRLQPTSPVFWFSMQIAMIAGFATALPANRWLIRTGLKEAM